MKTVHDMLTQLSHVAPEDRELWLFLRPLAMLREAADLQGASYADTMTKRQAIKSIIANF